MGTLLERDRHLAVLRGCRTGLVLIDGEAGGGKTSLVRAFTADRPRVLRGGCDPLDTPRPLGPFLEIAEQTGGELAALIATGAKPYQLAAALTGGHRPGTVLVLEDLHWADAATLDVLSMLGRRIDTVGLLIIATYRDGEFDRTHPLRRLLGELRGDTIRRLTVEPLSVAAVTALAGPAGRDGAALHRATGGNPFFVAEVLAQDGREVPATVRDAVLSRTMRLSDAAAAVLDAVAIAPPHAELWLLDAIAGDAVADGLDECLRAGVLTEVPGGVAFRHEIARITVEGELTPHRRRDLHRRALAALDPARSARPLSGDAMSDGTAEAARSGGDASRGGIDLARLSHHAEAAGDDAAVLRHAPAAAAHASSTGAHREAAAQYARALRAGRDRPVEETADLLEKRSYACYLTDQTEESIDALREAIRLRHRTGDRLAEGAAMSALSRRLWCGGRSDEAARAGRDAARLLEELPPGRELALAWSNLSQVHMNDEDLAGTLHWGRRALTLAGELGETVVRVHSLNNVGTMQLLHGRAEGRASLLRSLSLAVAAGLEEHVGRAYIHAGWAMTRTRAYATMAPLLDEGIATCEQWGLEGWKHYVLAYRAHARLDAADWDGARTDAVEVLRSAKSVPLLRILSLTVLGRLRARLGDGDPAELLDEAQELTAGQTELQYLAPVAIARAEAALLTGDLPAVAEIAGPVLAHARRRGSGWPAGELAWLRRLSTPLAYATTPTPPDPAAPDRSAHEAAVPKQSAPDRSAHETAVPDQVASDRLAQEAAVPNSAPDPAAPDRSLTAAGPFVAALAGDFRGAAEQWERLGCPFDAALALSGSADEDDLRRSVAGFQALGCRPAATIVARRLRERGVLRIPRGRQERTRGNPAELTARELEVLALVRGGLSNMEIAGRLFLAPKTVNHHVSAILRKLGVTRRGQAAAEAVRLGVQ